MKHLLIIAGFTIALLLLCIACGILVYVPEREIRAALSSILYAAQLSAFGATGAIVLVLGMAVIIGLYLAGCYAYNNTLAWQYSRQIKEAEAAEAWRRAHTETTVAPPGSQVYTLISQTAKRQFAIVPNHLQPATINGVHTPPAAEEIGLWKYYNVTQSISRKPDIVTSEQFQEPLMIEAPLPDYVDLADYCNGVTSLRNIFLGVGKFPDGQVRPVRAPLGRLVHIAMAGASGFGKSTLMKAIAYQVLNAKEQPHVVMLDGQGVTFTIFHGDERLLYPLASKIEDIRYILKELYGELERRDELFSQWRGVDSLERYNAVVDEPLPSIPILFDEFGIMADDKEATKYATKLAQAGRKVGMSLIVGSQTWYSNDISGAFRANLSTGVQFHAATKAQSRMLIGDSVAKELTRQGQAYGLLPGMAGLVELQTPDVSNVLDVEPVLIGESAAIRVIPEPEYTDDDYFIELVENGATKSQASMEAYGKPYAGTSHVKRCKRLLGEE